MLLLLLMYLAPVLAVALFWRANSALSGATARETLRAAVTPRLGYSRSVAGVVLLAMLAVVASTGPRGGVAFGAGILLATVAAALAYASFQERAGREGQGDLVVETWTEAAALSTALTALATGGLGALAWFFADPAGAIVLVAFAAGTSMGALFLGMAVAYGRGTPGAPLGGDVSASATGALHNHLPAVAATLIVAATAEPEALLFLGGLMAETETLRSELLLLPIGISVLSPLLALLGGPAVPSLLQRRGAVGFFDIERLAAALALVAMVAVVLAGGFAWVVAGAFAVGLVARQLAVLADEVSRRRIGLSDRSFPAMAPALLSAAALALGDQLAGTYGVALAALGMTATFASTAAGAIAAPWCSPQGAAAQPASHSDLDNADAATSIAVTLALLVAAAPVILADSAHRGTAMMLVATAAPALLFAVVAGAACAASFSARYGHPDDEAEAVQMASRATAAAVALPALAGVVLGAGAAVGVALGFAAWAAASTPLVEAWDAAARPDPRLRRSVLLAWGRAMALATVVGVPWMS
ncbi:MAG: hypothetical protein ABR538_03450 [Candidatus Binatia bacterium]